jgi:hypothetical protein
MPVQRSNGFCVPVANPLFSHYCALFAFFFSLLLFVFNGLRTLLPKHPGMGTPHRIQATIGKPQCPIIRATIADRGALLAPTLRFGWEF